MVLGFLVLEAEDAPAKGSKGVRSKGDKTPPWENGNDVVLDESWGGEETKVQREVYDGDDSKLLSSLLSFGHCEVDDKWGERKRC